MKYPRKKQLLFEELEERIFLDANPLATVSEAPVDPDPLPLADEAPTLEPTPSPVETAPPQTVKEVPRQSTTNSGDTPDEEQLKVPGSSLHDQGEDAVQPAVRSGDESDPETGEIEPTTAQAPELAAEAESPAANLDSEPQSTTRADDPAAAAEPEEINRVVFVDSTVSDHATLVDGLQQDLDADDQSAATEHETVRAHNTSVVILDGNGDQIEQISTTLADYSDLESVHIFSYGADNTLFLGDSVINAATLPSHAEEISAWGTALHPDGDLLLYGCNIARGETGDTLLTELAELTRADVAASDDTTGNSPHGDWELEVATGSIEADSLTDAGGEWQKTLDPPVPEVTVSLPQQGLIEETIDFTVSFDNSAAAGDPTNIGYGPYLDVYVPVGLNIQSGPSYGTAPVNTQVFTWDSAQSAWVNGTTVIDPSDLEAAHPFDSVGGVIPLESGIHDGDQWFVIELPFGSFAPEQPVIDINFTAEIDEDAVAGFDDTPDAADYSPGDAVVGVDLEVTARGGFRYGDDPLDNPNADPVIVQSSLATDTVTPQLFTITKTADANETETATGPNYPVVYTLEVDIAPDQVVDSLTLNDFLPDSAYYRDDIVITVKGSNETGLVQSTGGYQAPVPWQANAAPNNDFVLPVGNVTGYAADGTPEITVTYSVYYGLTDAAGAAVIDPVTGAAEEALNEANATGLYDNPVSVPGDDQAVSAGLPGTGDGDGTDDGDGSDFPQEINSITVTKGVDFQRDTENNPIGDNGAAGYSPGDFLTYTIDFEISDYFGFENIILTDTLGDGQHFVTASNPTLSIFQNGTSIEDTWDNTTLDAGGAGPAHSVIRNQDSGETTITFDISSLLGGTGELYGDLFDDDSGTAPDYSGGRPAGGTRGTVTFLVEIEEDFLQSGIDQSVDANDPITNDVVISGDVLEPDSAEPGEDYGGTGGRVEEDSATQIVIEGITTDKSISYVNGIAYDPAATIISPGDVVTYTFTLELPTGDIEDLILVDYLPLPVYDVGEFGATPLFANLDELFDATGDPQNLVIDEGSDLIVGGQIFLGEETDLHFAPEIIAEPSPWTPTVSSNGNANTLTFDLTTFHAESNTITVADGSYTIEILVTSTVTNEPFADGLYLTNQATWSYNNTFSSNTSLDNIAQIQLSAPEVLISKGVVATVGNGTFSTLPESLADLDFNAPDSGPSITFTGDGAVDAGEVVANPINADLTDADGGDLVTFAVAAYNVGGTAAYGLTIQDTLPGTGFIAPASTAAMNLQVWRGDNPGSGSPLDASAYTATLNGGELKIVFDPINGVLDGDRAGTLTDGTAGDDVFIITYDLEVDNETTTDPDVVAVGSDHTNTASITYYTSEAADVGIAEANWVDPTDPPSDDAVISIAAPSVEKTLLGSEIGADDTDGNNEPGVNEENEAVIGELVYYQVTITLPEGETAGAILQDTLEAGLTFVSLDAVATDGVTTDLAGGFGSVANSGSGQNLQFNLGNLTNLDTNNDELETLTLTYTAVVNNTLGNQDGTQLNNVARLVFDGGESNTDSADNITVIEPELTIDKIVNGNGTTTGDAGDTVEYTITIANSSATDAFDITFADQIPAAVENPTVSDVVWTNQTPSQTALFAIDPLTNELTLTNSIDILQGSSLVITVQGTLSQSVSPGQSIINNAGVTWESLDEGHTNNGTANERDGDDGPGTGLNNYAAQDSAPIDIDKVGITKILIGTSSATNGVENATIGETATYQVELVIPEGTLVEAQLEDALEAGLQFVSLDSISWPAGLTSDADGDTPANGLSLGEVAVTTDGDGLNGNAQTVSFALGTLENPGISGNDPQTITLEYTVLVVDDVANQNGQTRDNAATLTWGPEGERDGSDTSSVGVDIVEPSVSSEKLISTVNGGPYLDTITDVQAGQTLYYQVTFSNANTTAYEVTGEDLLPDGVSFIDGSATMASASGILNVADVVAAQSGNTIAFTNSQGGWDIEDNGSITIRYQVTVEDALVIGDTLTNSVDADWTGLDGSASSEERSYEDQTDANGDPLYAVDADQDTDDAQFLTPAVSIAKSDGNITEATIGETITYTLTITSPQGTLNDFLVQDQLPDGVEFVETLSISGNVNTTPAGPAAGSQGLSWNFGNTIHDDTDPIVITYSAIVTNDAVNTNGASKENTAQVSHTYVDDNGDTITITPDPATDNFELVEPQITTTKSVTDPTNPQDGVQPNDILTYTIRLENSGRSTAFEVTAEDILPEGVVYFGNPTASGASTDVSITDNGDGTLLISNSTDGWDIDPGDSLLITYEVQVKGAAYVVGAHTNFVDADWSGRPGAHATPDDFERIYDDGASQPLWPSVDGNQDEATADFITQVNPPVVGDFVWFDVNADGNQDPGEPGLAGVEVNLYGNDPDNFGNTILIATAVTDSNGWYEFTNLPLTNDAPDEVPPYRIEVVANSLPAGFVQTAEKPDSLDPNPSLNNQTIFDVENTSDNILDIDFGYTGSGIIGDTVWYDTNRDGAQDETGTGISGAEVTLRGDLDGDSIFDYTATAITDANGQYLFTNLPFVDYEVSVTFLPGGLGQQTGDPDATLDSRHSLTLTATQPEVETVDFGYVGTGSIGDTVWQNLNGDNDVDPGESGLANVTVTLTGDINFDGVDETFTTITDGNGNYTFDGLPAGEYTITVDPSTLPARLGAADANYDLDGGNESTTTISLGPGENNLEVDFGYKREVFGGVIPRGSIGDTVWLDLDGNGAQNSGNEIGLPDVTVNLLDDSGTVIAAAITDGDGRYFFGDLADGTYTVTVDTSSLPGEAGTLAQTFDLDGLGTPDRATVTLDATQRTWDSVDFGYQGSGGIGDTVWLDLDGNGTPDVGSVDVGLANVDVTLQIDFNGDDTPDAFLTATTDSAGSYAFNGLPFVEYTVIIDTDDLPDGITLVVDPDGGVANASTLNLTSASPTNLDQDFGYRGTGSIGDKVWNNANGNNLVDGSEGGISGVDVILTGDLNNDGVVSAGESITVTTNGDGDYLFDYLPAGEYTVSVDTNAGSLSGLNPNYDADGGNDATTDVVLAAGENNQDIDFGFSDRGSIGDTIWLDIDGDGIQDGGNEVGLGGVDVVLRVDLNDDGDTDDAGETQTTTTNSDGKYYFGDLENDTYTIEVETSTLPSGMIQTFDPDGARDNQSTVTLVDGNNAIDTVDFGYRGQGLLGDTVWLDLDGNNVPDVGAGDFGLANIDITLQIDFNGDGTPDTFMTATTDSTGRYLFDGLPYGTYTVTIDQSDLPDGVDLVVDPDGGSDHQSLSLLSDQHPSDLDQDFGYRGSGAIGDTIWQNLNGDSIVDPDEPLLPGVEVILTGDFNNDGRVDPTEQIRISTDTNGTYAFTGLANGQYSVSVDPGSLPDGLQPNFDADGLPDNRTEVILTDGNNSIDTIDFGYNTVANIGDTIWFDYDADGIQDSGEPGLAGVTVVLTDPDGNTFIDSTDENGQYLFTDLPPGAYTVTVLPTSLPTGGLTPTDDLDGIGTPNSASLVLTGGTTRVDADFGYTGTGSIGDTIWNDQNQNGLQDGAENGISGVELTVAIDLDSDGIPDFTVTTVTDSSGKYVVDNLPSGSHVVSVNPATLPEDIILSYDPDGTLDNAFVVALGPGEEIDTVDFGYYFEDDAPDAQPIEPGGPPPTPPGRPPGRPPVSPPAPLAELDADAFFLYRQFGGREESFPWNWEFSLPAQFPPLEVSPVYTGMAEPGTTLFLTLYDNSGNPIGYQTVMADTAGNWLASFPATRMLELPHHMDIEQTVSSYNSSSPGLFNTRTYFNPNFTSLVFSRSTLNVDTIFAYLPSTIMASMHASTHTPIDLHWNDFNGYEFAAPSINPSKNGH